MADRSYIARNDQERARLKALVAQWTDADLTHPMPADWTVSGVLAHMAFWDARVLFYLNRWAAGAEPSKEDQEDEDIDWINDSAKPLCLALPPRAAAKLVVDIAEETDARVAALPDDLVTKVHALGAVSLDRSDHRREHLDEIVYALLHYQHGSSASLG
jgi:hypothetical protein